ncbi:TNF receptor-associated factor 6 [Asbolus verrucosus]|uniref:TNF receptor-associated factor 6 n=1 Tax=Asbolus verrucosus TaxID=1661398 RepID=A0A482WBA5_ASBVE|nr:TNF receptor-associated factor 6 [Asbolus verrucosus]
MSSHLHNKSENSVAQESSITDNFSGPESRFECPICLAWLRDPVLTSCGHRFCRSCMESWLERENACCPIDNTKLHKDVDIFPDNFTRREISQQKTKCPNIVRGCLEELSPLDVETHLAVCKYKPPELPENEKLRCSYVHVGCEDKFEDEPELQRHLEQHTQKHLNLLLQAYTKFAINTQNAASSSAIAQQANFWDPPSKNEPPVTASDNINGLLKALYEKVVLLEQKTREQDIIIANMSEQISSFNLTMSKMHLRYCNGCYLWYFNDFKCKINAMRNDSHIMHYSPGFYTSTNGYRLCIRLNLSPKDPNYIAILIHVMKTEHDHTLDWPFSGRLTVTLVHPLQSFRNIKETMMTRPELEAFKRPVQDMNPKGFGYTEFALIEELFTNGYVDNNQLLIKVHAQPV